MKCEQCDNDFEEREIEESHDVPCYLFRGFNRNEKKNHADKFNRRYLCGKCHKDYELILHFFLINQAKEFAIKYFEGKK